MYGYLLGQWRLGSVTAEYIQARVPKWITQEQADVIVATPQDLVGTLSVTQPTV